MRTVVFKKFVLVPVCLCLVFLSNCSEKKSSDDKSASVDTIAVKVLDGDTFVLSSGKKVRIAIIDTPESGEPFHNEALIYLEKLVLGKKVSLKLAGSGSDRYNRTLAEVYVDSVNVGRSLLNAGLALVYQYPDNAYLKDEYLPYQIEAIERKAGIWSLPEPVAEEYYVYIKGSFRFHRPLCYTLKKTSPEKFRRIETRNQALLQGFSPCRNCRP